MRALVTGGTGFIGSNLVQRLLEEGHDVIITGEDVPQRLPGFKGKCLHPSFVGIDFDAIGHVDVLFHQAAINDTQFLDRDEIFRANVASSRALFDYVLRQGCRRIVYASSTAIYGNSPAPYRESETPLDPLNPYAESKIALEALAWELAASHRDLVIVGLRYCNVYGPGESHKGKRSTMIWQLAQQMKAGNPRIFKWGEQKRDYIYVADVVQANLLAAQASESCVVNCGSGTATTFTRLIEILNGVLATQRTPEFFDNPYLGRYQDHTECDMSLAEAKIAFVPRFSIEEGIQDYAQNGLLK